MLETLLIIVSALAGGLVVLLVVRKIGRRAPLAPPTTHTIAERVRAVGKLVALEVQAKEIATSTRGWSWVPPIILSQAKVAMIFHFEKQYSIDLARLREEDVEPAGSTGSGRSLFRIRLPEVESTLRLVEVVPYDIQAGRVLGLIDVIQMDAKTQSQLMKSAQEQAATLMSQAETRYINEARRAVEQQLRTLLAMFEVEISPTWPGSTTARAAGVSIALGREPVAIGAR